MRKIIFDFSEVEKIESDQGTKPIAEKKEEMEEYIARMMKEQHGEVGLGIHAVRKEKVKGASVEDILKQICENGLEIKKGSTVLATISSLGVSSELRHHQKEALRQYKLGNEMADNGVIAMVPTVLEGNGQQIYVGFPGMDTSAMGNNHKKTCLLDSLCCGENEYGVFPKEFILGYFRNENGKRVFHKNEQHFFEMTEEERGAFIQSLFERLTEQEREVSEAVLSGNKKRLEELSMQRYGNTEGSLGEDTVIQNAMLYLDRQLEQTIPQQQDRRKSMLFEAYRDVKRSDLQQAKAQLQEGLEDRQIQNEGREI